MTSVIMQVSSLDTKKRGPIPVTFLDRAPSRVGTFAQGNAEECIPFFIYIYRVYEHIDINIGNNIYINTYIYSYIIIYICINIYLYIKVCAYISIYLFILIFLYVYLSIHGYALSPHLADLADQLELKIK